MKVFVTGATGFVGSVLVRQLIDEGVDVKAIKRPSSKLDQLGSLADQIEWVEGDVGNVASLVEGISGTQGVFHCAAYLGFDGNFSRELQTEVNVGGTANVVNACLSFKDIRLVHVSSIAALGRSENRRGELSEKMEWVTSSLNTDYAISKHLAEMEVYRGVAEGLDAVIVNPALIMGPGRKGENTMQISEKLLSKSLPFIPTGGTNVVDVEDVAIGARAAFRKGTCGERYILSGHNMEWGDIITALAKPLNVDPPKRIIGPSMLKAIAYLSEGWAKISRTKPLINRESARLSSSISFYTNAKATEQLDFRPRPFSETASRIAASLLLMLLLLFSGCSPEPNAPESRPTIVTTLPVLKLILEPVAVEYAFEVLLADGQSPHGFQVSPSGAKRLSKAQLLVYAHQEIDGWAADLAPSNHVALWDETASEDAHFWTDPVLASDAAKRFADTLCTINPNSCPAFRRRAVSFSVRVDSVSRSIENDLNHIKTECFIVAHSFMTQFLDRFGIHSIGPIQPLPGHDASPRTLANMMDEAKRSNCKTLLVQKAVDNRSMNALATDLGAKLVVVDPLGSEVFTYEAYLSALSQALLQTSE